MKNLQSIILEKEKYILDKLNNNRNKNVKKIKDKYQKLQILKNKLETLINLDETQQKQIENLINDKEIRNILNYKIKEEIENYENEQEYYYKTEPDNLYNLQEILEKNKIEAKELLKEENIDIYDLLITFLEEEKKEVEKNIKILKNNNPEIFLKKSEIINDFKKNIQGKYKINNKIFEQKFYETLRKNPNKMYEIINDKYFKNNLEKELKTYNIFYEILKETKNNNIYYSNNLNVKLEINIPNNDEAKLKQINKIVDEIGELNYRVYSENYAGTIFEKEKYQKKLEQKIEELFKISRELNIEIEKFYLLHIPFNKEIDYKNGYKEINKEDLVQKEKTSLKF